jgi:serine/threonine-protein kinase
LTGERYLTPAYASPEQLRSEPITTAADVYSLGVILYELLTGQKPYQLADNSLSAFERAVCEQQPDLPSVRITQPESRRLRGDLDNIVLMALRKEPQRRYVSVEQFSEDVHRHLVGLPVIARPDTLRYRSVKFVKRNRLPVALVAVAFMLLSALTVVTLIQSARAKQQRTLAEQRYEQTQRVAEFQAAMLRQLDAETMGRTIAGELRKQAEAGLARQKLTTTEIAAALRQFDDALRPANSVDASRRIVDSSLLRPALEAIPVEFKGQPQIEAKLRRTIGGVYLGLGLYDSAEQQLREALVLQRGAPAVDRAELASTLNSLGQALRLKRDFAAAEPALREALAIRRSLTPAQKNPDVAASLNSLGLLLLDKDDPAAAEPLFDEALDTLLDVPGHLDEVANTLQLIAGLRFTRKDFAGAEDYFRQALQILRKLRGNEDSRVASCLIGVAAVLDARGEHVAATPFIQEAIGIRSRTLGEEHPATLNDKLNLAGIYISSHRHAEAESILLDVLRAKTSACADPQPTLRRLAELYRDWGKPDTAAEYEAKLARLPPPEK